MHFLIDDAPHPRRQVAGCDRQQLGRTDVLVQHDVSGELLYQPNAVEHHSRTYLVIWIASIAYHPSNVIAHLVVRGS